MPEPELFHAPDDLTLVSDADLAALRDQAVAEFDRVLESGEHTAESIAYSARVTDDLDRIRAELRVREVRHEATAETARLASERQMAALRNRVHGDGDGGEETPALAAAAASGPTVDLGSLTEATARGVALALFGDDTRRIEQVKQRVASLSSVRDRAPDPKVPAQRSAITASVEIPGVAAGQELPTMEALGSAFQNKAKAIPITRDGRHGARHLVASVRNSFEHTVDERTSHAEIESLLRSMTETKASSAQALVAGGGWCAPSEISYDFFNIAGQPRMIDLPSLGVSRGGIRFPVSPAIGDVFFSAGAASATASGMGGFAFAFGNGTDPWLWTESDDILTVTGSVNKPTLRVPCPSFSEVRLECYGISLTAGNLTDDAYPESTQNFIRLLRAAYAHAINARLIGLMQTASASAVAIGTAANAAVPQIPNAAALAATDYRNRYAMDEDAVLEVVYPFWILELMRSDLGYKPGIDSTALLAVVDAEIMGLYTSRNIRPQFVSDWQVRATGLPGVSTENLAAWPTSVDFLLYAAGTFVHGTGLQLDLGVIRDSVLNAENDYTALWAEECHLIAKVGHVSRRYTLSMNVGGNVAVGVTGAKV